MTPGFFLDGWVDGGSSLSPHPPAPSLPSVAPPPGSLLSSLLDQVPRTLPQPFAQRCLHWP